MQTIFFSLLITNIFALSASVCWAIFEPGFEPIITCSAFTASLISLLAKKYTTQGILKNTDITIDETNKTSKDDINKSEIKTKKTLNLIFYFALLTAFCSVIIKYVPLIEIINFISDIVVSIFIVLGLAMGLFATSFYVGMMVLHHYHNLESNLLKDITDWAGYTIYREIIQIEGVFERLVNIDKYFIQLPRLAYHWYKYGDETWKELWGDVYFNKSKPDIDLDDINIVLAYAKQKEGEEKNPLALFSYFRAKALLEQEKITKTPVYANVLLGLSRLLKKEVGNKKRLLPFYFRLRPHIKNFENEANIILEHDKNVQ